MQLALNNIGKFKDLDFGLDDRIHPVISPSVIMIMGSSFICNGRNVRADDIGLIHVRAAPAVIAIKARSDMGLIIGISS